MRRERGVKANEEDNFDFFSSESLITQFNEMTQGVKLAAFVIGIIALVVAGIGIMNIMLVSVTERTREIGIRKSLGAKPRSILLQFLLEAVILCNIGGVVGVMAGFGLGNVVTLFAPFDVNVPMEWAVIGLVFCSAVGIMFRSAAGHTGIPAQSGGRTQLRIDRQRGHRPTEDQLLLPRHRKFGGNDQHRAK